MRVSEEEERDMMGWRRKRDQVETLLHLLLHVCVIIKLSQLQKKKKNNTAGKERACAS